MRAKTGTLIFFDAMNERMLLRSKAIAGTIETAKGSKLCFAIFVNDVPLPHGVSASREGKVLGQTLRDYLPERTITIGKRRARSCNMISLLVRRNRSF